MTRAITTIGFDADDTLWHNARFFRLTQQRFFECLADHADPATLRARLLDAEARNLGHYGYGVKGFVLSMIETAIDVTDRRVPAAVIADLIAAGREMLEHPVELLPHARTAIETLAARHRLVLLTKGDLLDQERKLAQSGLGELFDAVEIVSDKTPGTYTDVFGRHGDGAARAMMIGDSLRSDVIPMIAAGGWGVHVPHAPADWALEAAEPPRASARFRELAHLGELPALIARLTGE
ncbi:HAD family hydrolase [Rhodobacteraceae bacterium WD3A24]|nr:HAD family hydrolase [Rhodobacteraceae bacterium WD3A24]